MQHTLLLLLTLVPTDPDKHIAKEKPKLTETTDEISKRALTARLKT